MTTQKLQNSNNLKNTIKTNRNNATIKRNEFLNNPKLSNKMKLVLTDKNYFYIPTNLLGTSKKTEKGDGTQFLTKILYLAPSFLSSYNTCVKATIGCSNACLNQNGNGRYNNTQISRINKTKFFYLERNEFMKKLIKEIKLFVFECELDNIKPIIRINGTSDINILLFKLDNKNLLDLFPTVIFYDYTKVLNRFNNSALMNYSNYFLTSSRDENNEKECLNLLEKGFNSAFVFNCKTSDKLPKMYKGFKVVDGDKNDLRHIDYENNKGNNKGVIIGLIAKGKAKTDKTGFTIHEF